MQKVGELHEGKLLRNWEGTANGAQSWLATCKQEKVVNWGMLYDPFYVI